MTMGGYGRRRVHRWHDLPFRRASSDCNGNGVDDASELGPDTDCDGSGVLDGAMTDCDLNGVPDVAKAARRAQRSVRKRHPHGLERTSDWQHRVCWRRSHFGDQCSTAAFTGGPDVFYSISLVEAGTIDLWTCNSDYDTLSIHNPNGSVVVRQ